ncbi:MAG: hypothetical protein GWN86_25995, partial [Desulfobacterales bacterium]|nr:hypothetical protein [Desulfobacterales bacterium]
MNEKVPRIVMPKLRASADTIANTPTGDRKFGWFFMFENDLHPSIVCLKCREIATLTDHKVSPDGLLEPSIVCPNEDCGWHVFGRLNEWDPPLTYSDSDLAAFVGVKGDPLLSSLAYEVLYLRRRLEEQAPDEFQKMVAYGVIGLNLGQRFAKAFSVPTITIKKWALGLEKPPPAM